MKDISKYKVHDVRTSRKINKNTISLTIADSDFATPDFITSFLSKKILKGNFSYNKGEKIFNERIPQYLYERFDYKRLSRENIIYSKGAIFILQGAIATHTKHGDYVMIPNPIYGPFINIVKNMGRKIITFDYQNGKIDFKKFDKLIVEKNVKLILFCHPHNPSGNFLDLKSLINLKKIIDKNNVLLYSDEVWNEIIFSEKKFHSFSSIDKSNKSNIVSIMGLGKTFLLQGLSFAFATSYNQKNLEHLFNTLKSLYYSSHFSPVVINAVDVCFTKTGYMFIEEYKKIIWNNYQAIESELKLSKIIVPPLESTHLLWIDFKNIDLSHEKIYKILLNNNLQLQDGMKFGKNGMKKFRVNLSVSLITINKFLKIIAKIKEFYE